MFSEKEKLKKQEGLEGRIESMAENLVARMASLQKRLNALHASRISEKERAKIQKWADIENGELINLKKSIWEQKWSYLKCLSSDDRISLANRHPAWMVYYEIYLDQIREPFLAYRDKKAIVQCILKPQQSKALKIYRYGGGGAVLCINSDRCLRYEDDHAGEANQEWTTPIGNLPKQCSKFVFRPYDKGRAQWIFTGDAWGLDNDVLWLDFCTQEEREFSAK